MHLFFHLSVLLVYRSIVSDTSCSAQNYHVAQYRLGKMIYEGGYYRRIPENAAYWLTLSAKQNNQYAEMLLGRLYLHGDFLRL